MTTPVWDVTIESKDKKKMNVLRFSLEITRFCLPDILDCETKQISPVDSADQTLVTQNCWLFITLC